MKKPNKRGKSVKKKGKKKYKVRNWKEYNQMLVNRGSIFFWIEQSEQEKWKVRQHGFSKRRTWRKFHPGIMEILMGGMPESYIAE